MVSFLTKLPSVTWITANFTTNELKMDICKTVRYIIGYHVLQKVQAHEQVGSKRIGLGLPA